MFSYFKYVSVASRLNFHGLHTSLYPITTTFTPKFNSILHQILHNLLEKCSSMRELKQIHAQIIVHRITIETLTMGKLVSFCAVADTGNLEYAQLVFDQIPEPNKFMYNSLIRGYSNSCDPVKGIFLYRRMVGSGLSPNEFTLPFVLKACASEAAYWEAVVVHGHGIKLGIGSQVCVQNSLINVFVVCGLVGFARQVFDEILERTLVSWNSMIGGYLRTGCCKDAFLLFGEMRELGMEPDEFTFVSLLSVCSQTCDIDMGRCVHLYIVVTGVKVDLIVRNALVDMYAKCGDLHSAQTIFDRMSDKSVISWTSMLSAYAKHGFIALARKFFDQMPVKNVVAWNSMISSYVREGQCKEALEFFHKMCNSRVVPDEATLVSVLSACSQIGDLVMGKKIHDCICNNNIIPSTILHNSLIDMYGKCGAIKIAMNIFLEMPEKNVVSWNVIIAALALHGHGLEATKLFENMQACGIWPDAITFTGLLSACSHSGLIEMGQYYFERMSIAYKVKHEIEHYACMVDLLGRGGLLKEAVRLIVQMPMRPDVVVWGALLGACRTHHDLKLGKQILKQLLELEQFSAGLYVLLANLYCEAERWEKVKKIRKLMDDRRIKKCRAISFIEIGGCVYEFMVDDKRHETSSSIYSMLAQLTDQFKSEGNMCNLPSAYLDVEEI